MTGKLVENTALSLSWRPNRSLSSRGRLLWFGLIATTTLLFAVAAALMGAWMVLPFAGGEVLLVWLAFKWIARGDGDYETLNVASHEFDWERCERGRVSALRGNRVWAKLVSRSSGGRVDLQLVYAGKSVAIAKFMSDEQRENWHRDLRRVFGGGQALDGHGRLAGSVADAR